MTTSTEEKGYNGWKNYETWNAALWIDNDQGAHERWNERAVELLEQAIEADESDDPRNDATHTLAEELEADCDETLESLNLPICGMFADILNAGLREIDWFDIAEHYLADIEIWSAGWNMPGYMPDSEPCRFTDNKAAREYIADQLDTLADETDAPDLSKAEDDLEAAGNDFDNAAKIIRAGKGEYGATIGDYHYFVTQL